MRTLTRTLLVTAALAVSAAQKGLESPNYRDIIRELKKHRVAGDQVLPVYKAHLAQLEDTIRKQKIVKLHDFDSGAIAWKACCPSN